MIRTLDVALTNYAPGAGLPGSWKAGRSGR